MTSRRPAPGGWDALTAAERRVADLVTEGLTNPQIAARLFLSRHTVQTHLRNTFRKLGLANRSQLAVEVVLHRAATKEEPAMPGGRVLHRGSGFALGVFHCRPGDPRWGRENFIGTRHHVVFPTTAVLIRRPRAELVADPNVAVLYDGGETYRRSLVDPRGDHCSYASIDGDLLAEMCAAPGRTPVSFPRPDVPVDARIYALQWMVMATLAGFYDRDRLATDEDVLTLLGVVVRSAFAAPKEPSGNAARLVTRTKEVLAGRLSDPLTVADVAREIPVSPYHLIRLFRRETGMTLHRYRTHLRLRASLDRLAVRDESIGAIATSLGFSSHGHFSDTFRRTFGVTPTDVRAGRPPTEALCGVLASSRPR